ncbi:MAG: helix-turn-helix transcriptional regulator [Rikenellaceae bacterium]
MEKNKNTEFISFDEVMDETFGKKGTPERANYDMSIELWMVGQKIKEIREAKRLTQDDLGRLIGVQKAQVSRIENGKNLTVATIIKVFKALNVEAKLKIEDIGIELSLS